MRWQKTRRAKVLFGYLPTYWPTKGIIESGFGNRFHPVYKKFMDHTVPILAGKRKSHICRCLGKVVFAAKNGVMGTVLISITVMVL